MKRFIVTAMLLVGLQAAYAQTLLDSLQGKWEVTKITTNNKNTLKAGTLFFSDDGKLVSSGNYFGSMNALYTTNETTSTVQIEAANKKVTEWEVIVKSGTLFLTSIDDVKGKKPIVRIVAMRKND